MAAWGSLIIGAVVLALKFGAWWLTGSLALYSDVLESIVNVVAAGAAVVALTISARPADANHPYGQNKAEYFSAVIEGVMVVVAALSIFRRAYLGWFAPEPPSAPLKAQGDSGQWAGDRRQFVLVAIPDPERSNMAISSPGRGREASAYGPLDLGRRAHRLCAGAPNRSAQNSIRPLRGWSR